MGKMKFSVIISLCIHVLIFYALLTLFEIVPRVDLPDKVYSVRIFSPRKTGKKEEPKKTPEVKVEKPKPPPKAVEKKEPSDDVKEKKPKETAKAEPQKEKENKPLDVIHFHTIWALLNGRCRVIGFPRRLNMERIFHALSFSALTEAEEYPGCGCKRDPAIPILTERP
jgi:hypothetical protein